MTATDEPDPVDSANDEIAVGRDGHSATAEEAMDAATDQDGHVEESAYTPTPGLQEEPGSDESKTR